MNEYIKIGANLTVHRYHYAGLNKLIRKLLRKPLYIDSKPYVAYWDLAIYKPKVEDFL